MFTNVADAIAKHNIVSAYTLNAKGIVPAVSKMAFGNMLGVTINEDVDAAELFAPKYGCIVAEVPADKVSALTGDYRVIGFVNDKAAFEYGNVSIDIKTALDTWKSLLRRYSQQLPLRVEKSLIHLYIMQKRFIFVK